MTPPPPAGLRDRTAQRSSRLRTAAPPRPDWDCDNCTQPNPGRRRRCVDCGTSRA